jgi:hypothetical protein
MGRKLGDRKRFRNGTRWISLDHDVPDCDVLLVIFLFHAFLRCPRIQRARCVHVIKGKFSYLTDFTNSPVAFPLRCLWLLLAFSFAHDEPE